MQGNATCKGLLWMSVNEFNTVTADQLSYCNLCYDVVAEHRLDHMLYRAELNDWQSTAYWRCQKSPCIKQILQMNQWIDKGVNEWMDE